MFEILENFVGTVVVQKKILFIKFLLWKKKYMNKLCSFVIRVVFHSFCLFSRDTSQNVQHTH